MFLIYIYDPIEYHGTLIKHHEIPLWVFLLHESEDEVTVLVSSIWISQLGKTFEGVVALWYYPLTLQPEQSGGVGLNPGRAPPLERHNKGLRTPLGLLYFCDPSAWL